MYDGVTYVPYQTKVRLAYKARRTEVHGPSMPYKIYYMTKHIYLTLLPDLVVKSAILVVKSASLVVKSASSLSTSALALM